ncbi:MAG: DJ-1/PfpI family protein [Thiohalorhabdaceae bacterium]
MSRVVVPLVDGFEEIEALTIVDILRRAGIDVVTAAVSSNPVSSSHSIRIEADTSLAAVREDPAVEMVVLPGGPGTAKLGESADLRALVERLQAQDGAGGAGWSVDHLARSGHRHGFCPGAGGDP